MIIMENKIKLFNFKGNKIKVFIIDYQPYFIGKEIAEILGYSNTRDALAKLVDEDDKITVAKRVGNKRGNPNKIIINEPGLYSLILSSKLPNAKKFKRWVTHKVLPEIKKCGSYTIDKKASSVISTKDGLADLIQQAADQLEEERTRRLIAEQQVKELQPKNSYYDLVLKNKSLLAISVIAKDYGMSTPAFNDLLHELKIQYKQGSIWLLYSKYQSLGWTSSQTKKITHTNGRPDLTVSTRWTQKGRLGLYELLKNKHNLLPIIERDLVGNKEKEKNAK